MIRKIFECVFIVLAFFKCDGNYHDVSISGNVIGCDSQEKIGKMRVVVFCHEYRFDPGGGHTSDVVRKLVLTDTSGYFEVSFVKGSFIEVIVLPQSINFDSLEYFDSFEYSISPDYVEPQLYKLNDNKAYIKITHCR